MRSLADRIKKYEKISHYSLSPKIPVMIRLDGKSFHNFTKHFDKPFSNILINTMIDSATYVFTRIQGCKVAYIQSDEVTFCITDYDNINSEGWFDYDLSKLISISASMMSTAFITFLRSDDYCVYNDIPIFDSRAFNIPVHDVVNAFLWRAKDWERNSLQMYCQSLFKHKELQNKKKADLHEMLYSVNKNWTTDLSDRERNGTFLIKRNNDIQERSDILPTYEFINNNIGDLFIVSDYNKQE